MAIGGHHGTGSQFSPGMLSGRGIGDLGMVHIGHSIQMIRILSGFSVIYGCDGVCGSRVKEEKMRYLGL
jgi:hypothetical protein